MKKILSLCMILVFLLMPLGSQITLAEEEKTGATISENLFKGHTDDLYKGKYYEIDTEAPKKDDKGVLQKLGGYIFGDDNIGQDIQRMIYSICQWFVNLAFKLNIMLTQLTMFLVDQALKLDIVSGVADKLAEAMQNISGIGKGQDGTMGFLSGGLFPSIISIACVLSACYAAYIFFVKRQPTAGLNELVKTVLVIAFILVFIGNASTVLKTTNTISSEISTTILAKTTGTVAGDPNRSKEDAISAVKKQIWGILVERPYLFLQYGEDSKEKIGAKRVDELLGKSPGTDRNNMVNDEVKQGNKMMKMESVGERIIFTIIYYIVNPLVGIPILAFCLLIVAFQLWFLVMSLIAPIVLAVALLPGHRRVMESWITQWVRPLALKVLMSVMLVIIFTVSELIYVLPEAGLAGYVSTMVFQIIVFILCYIFRDNITACFAKTKNIYRTVTDISLMTERFVDRGKDVAMGVGGYIGEQVGNHFNTAAELAANGGAVENEDTLDEEKKPNLMKANVPDNLSDDENQEQNNEQDEDQKQLVSLQDEEQVTDTEEQEEQDLEGRQNLTHLDQEELAEIMERSEEVTPAELENDVSDQNYASLEELELTPEQEITSLQDAPQELSAIDIVDYPTNELETTTLSSNSTPAANPTNPIRKTVPVEPTQDQIIASLETPTQNIQNPLASSEISTQDITVPVAHEQEIHPTLSIEPMPVEPTQNQIIATPEVSTPNVQEPLVSNEIPAQDIMVPVAHEQEIHPTLSTEPMPVEPTQDQVIATPEIPAQNIQEPMVSSEIPTQAIPIPAIHEQEIHPTLSTEPMPVEPVQDQVIATPGIPAQNIQEPLASSEIPTQAIPIPATPEQEIHPTLSTEPMPVEPTQDQVIATPEIPAQNIQEPMVSSEIPTQAIPIPATPEQEIHPTLSSEPIPVEPTQGQVIATPEIPAQNIQEPMVSSEIPTQAITVPAIHEQEIHPTLSTEPMPVEPTQDQVIATPEIPAQNIQEPMVSSEIPTQAITVPAIHEQEIHPTLSTEPMPVEPTQDQVIATPEIPAQNIQEPMVSSEIPTQAITVPAIHEQEIHPTLSTEPMPVEPTQDQVIATPEIPAQNIQEPMVSSEIPTQAIPILATPEQEIHPTLSSEPIPVKPIPSQIRETGTILTQKSSIDVDSTIPQSIVETANENKEIHSTQEIELPTSLEEIPSAIAVGNETWHLPTPKQLDRLESSKEE